MVRSDCYLTFQKPVALLSPFACPESQVNREYVNRSQLQRLIRIYLNCVEYARTTTLMPSLKNCVIKTIHLGAFHAHLLKGNYEWSA